MKNNENYEKTKDCLFDYGAVSGYLSISCSILLLDENTRKSGQDINLLDYGSIFPDK